MNSSVPSSDESVTGWGGNYLQFEVPYTGLRATELGNYLQFEVPYTGLRADFGSLAHWGWYFI